MPETTNRGTTIRIFLIDGTPSGMRLVDKSGWSGSCLDFSRADYARARLREEVGRSGVYVLVGPDEEQSEGGRRRVYVGEGDIVRTRLDQHQKQKAFWTRAYVFTSKDDSLNKAHVRYLEASLVGLARSAGLVAVDNETEPPVKGLSEADRAEMDAYLDEALLLLPLIGVEAFSPVIVAAPTRRGSAMDPEPSVRRADEVSATTGAKSPDVVPGDSHPYLLREGRKGRLTVEAEARDASRGFVVLKGAVGPSAHKVMTLGYLKLREQMIADGILVPVGAEQLTLTRNFVFDSPSAAAAVLSGGSRRGPTVWKDANGRTLSECRSAEVPK